VAVVSGNMNTFVSDEYNLIGTGNSFGPGDASSALDIFNAAGDQTGVLDPGLAALADNGGITWTHALLHASPAVDAGDPSAQANLGDVPEFDQRTTPFGRVSDGNGDSTATIDIGAFERADPSADFDGDLVIDGLDFLAWQRGFGTLAPNATKADGDADNDLDTDGDDLVVWESQYGQAAPLSSISSTLGVEPNNEEQQVAAGLSPVVFPTIVTLAVADPLVNIGASKPTSDQLASANKEAFFGDLPANVMLRLEGPDLGLNVRTSAPGEKLPEATGFTEHLDLAFSDEWDSLDAVGQISRA